MADENLMEMKEHVSDISSFDPTGKKKKKKKAQVRAADSVDELTEKTDKFTTYAEAEDAYTNMKKMNLEPVESFDLSDSNIDSEEDIEGEDKRGNGFTQSQYLWEETERDYEYEELLHRVFILLRENNPELAGDRCRTIIRPPQVLLEGTTKTVFVNFMDLCKTMHRQPEHVMTFLLGEMGTSGSLDKHQRLVVKGRFASKSFEGIVQRYIKEYVICSTCKSPDTIFSKENRLCFLSCEQCGSERSVAPIKAGYVARVERRKAGT